MLGDLIVHYADQPIASVDDLHRALAERTVGATARITVMRGTERLVREIVPVESQP